MATGSITKRTVLALAPAEREYVLWDKSLRGFGVKVTPQGRKVYLVQYRTGGRGSPTKRITIGPHHDTTLTADMARTKAGELLAQVKLGGDPAGSKAAKRREPTISKLCDRYAKEHVDVHLKPSTATQVKRVIEKHIRPKFGTTKIGDLTRAKIKEWHAAMCDTPYEANRRLAYLSKMLSLAATEWELRPDNPCKGIRRFKERKRERYFDAAELKKLGEALVAAHNSELPGCIAAIRLLALTGCRMSEVRNLLWTDVDLEHGLLKLRDSKTGARTVPLATAAVAFLRTLAKTGDYVASGLDADQPISTSALEKAWARIRDKAGLENARLHDLRHTAATLAALSGANAFALRDTFGWATLDMPNRYVSRAADRLQATADSFGDPVAAALDGREPAEVVNLPTKAAG